MLRHRCTISRNAAVSTRRAAVTVAATSVPCQFTPLADRQSIDMGYSVGQAWRVAFGPTTDVRRGDRLTYNNLTYLVQGTKPFQGFGAMSYQEVLAVSEQANG